MHEFIKKNSLIAGCACHSLQVVKDLEQANVDVDFYMKSFHPDNYWSATPKKERTGLFSVGQHDNMWCMRPEETTEFMKTVKKPLHS